MRPFASRVDCQTNHEKSLFVTVVQNPYKKSSTLVMAGNQTAIWVQKEALYDCLNSRCMVQREVNEDDLMLHKNSCVNRHSIQNFDDLPGTAFRRLCPWSVLFACSPAIALAPYRD